MISSESKEKKRKKRRKKWEETALDTADERFMRESERERESEKLPETKPLKELSTKSGRH